MSGPRGEVQIEQWAKELIDLSRRNRALYYRPTKRTTLELVAPAPASIHAALIDEQIYTFFEPPPPSEGRPWTVQDSVDSAGDHELVTPHVETGELEKTLKAISRAAEQDLVDRAVQTLYVCFGMLEWKEAPDDEAAVRSPLLYVPVELVRESPRDPFRLGRAPEDILLNPSLVVKLEHDFGIDLSEIAQTANDAEELGDVLYDVQELVRPREWTVRHAAILKRSTFHKESMYRDLLDNIEVIAEHEIVRALAGDPSGLDERTVADLPDEFHLDDEAPPEDAHLILDADASQRRAILAAMRGASFVMDGPPGTGKSQTIANMIAELITAGKRVLFVSEKAAALDVVAKRLREHGLDDFALELHSHKASRKEVVQELDRSLNHHLQPQPRMTDVDRSRARQRRLELTAYADAVNEPRQPLGRTVVWGAGQLAGLHDVPALPAPTGVGQDLDARVLDRWLQRFEQLARVWAPAIDDDFVWKGYRGGRLRLGDREELTAEIEQARDALALLREAGDELAYRLGLDPVERVDDAARAVDLALHLGAQPYTPVAWWTEPSLEPVRERLGELRGQLEQRAMALNHLRARYTDSWEPPQDLTAVAVREVSVDIASRFPNFDPAQPISLEVARQAQQTASELEARLDAIESDTAEIAQRLGMGPRPRTLDDLARIGAVAVRAAETVRPEPDWVSPSVAAQVRDAIQAIGPLQERFARQWEALSETFTPEIFNLDLVTLRVRLSETSGLRKLSRPYREAKATLKPVARSGRADRSTLERVPVALDALKTREQLDQQEQRYRQVLGRYYRQYETDLEGAKSALALLEDVLNKLGDDADPSRIAAQFTGQTPEDPDLPRVAARVVDAIGSLMASLEALGPLALHQPGEMTVAELRGWARERFTPVGRLVRCLEVTEPHRNATASLRELEEDVTHLETLLAVNAALAHSAERDTALLGDWNRGVDTNTQAALDALSWMERCRELLGGAATMRQVERCRVDASSLPTPAEVQEAREAWDKAIRPIRSRFQDDRHDELDRSFAAPVDGVLAFFAELVDRIQDIDVWAEHCDLRNELHVEGFEATLHAAQLQQVDAQLLPAALKRATLSAWLDDVLASDERLDRTRPEDRHALVEEFRALDRQLIEDAAERVIEVCNRHRPRTNIGGVAVIRREAQKKRRHMPVRTLLSKTVEVAAAIKPCFMMSPLSVSQFLPSGSRFDVVIFDEASQIPPADAINCIYRGEQLIIAGDDRQLPPTSFFQASMDEDDVFEEEQFDEFESVLGLCKAAELLQDLPLKWHYRSHHEDLITFSNYQFYEGQLVTYPGADPIRPDLGVELFIVDGTYRRGGRRDNPTEARFIAQRVLHHATQHPHLSLGVVALSIAQAEAIEDAVDELRRQHPELDRYFASDRLDGFFVKNLENVQGDERDLIILSIGYGRDETGKFTMNFGPLNRDKGWRRLNVAVTRARRRVEAVSSFTPEEMRLANIQSRGIRELHAYLRYLQQGVGALAVDVSESQGDVESPLEEAVLRTIRSWGYDVVPQVGAAGYRIDLGVRDPDKPGRFLLGVECDGAAYHSSRVARDRDRLRQEVLEGLGWRLHRVWGPSWFRYREIAEADLRTALEEAARDPRPPASKTQPTRRVARERATEAVDLAALPTWAAHYEPASPLTTTFERAHSSRGLGELPRIIEEVVQAESPVHREVVGRRVADAFGHNLTKRTQQAVDGTLDSLAHHGQLEMRGDFAYLGELTKVRVPRRPDDPARREARHIPHEEVELAVYHLLSDARSTDEDELLEAVKQLFGFARMGPHVAAALERALAALQQRGIVERAVDGRLRVVEDSPDAPQ